MSLNTYPPPLEQGTLESGPGAGAGAKCERWAAPGFSAEQQRPLASRG